MIKKIVCSSIVLICNLIVGMEKVELKTIPVVESFPISLDTNESIKKFRPNGCYLTNTGRVFTYNNIKKNIVAAKIAYSLPKIFFGLFKNPVWKHITDIFELHNSNTDKYEDYLAIATENDIFLAKIIKNNDGNIIQLEIQKKLGSHNTPIHLLDLYYVKDFKQYILFSSSSYPSSKFWAFYKATNTSTEPIYSSHPGYMVIGCDLRTKQNVSQPIFAAIKDKQSSSLFASLERWQQRKDLNEMGILGLYSYDFNQGIYDPNKTLENQINIDFKQCKINFKQCKTFATSWINKGYILIQQPTNNMLYQISIDDGSNNSIAINNLTLENIIGIHCMSDNKLVMVTKKGLALIDEAIFKSNNNGLVDYYEFTQSMEITASLYSRNRLAIVVRQENLNRKNELKIIPLKNFNFSTQLNVQQPRYTMSEGPTIQADYKQDKSQFFEKKPTKLICTIQEVGTEKSTLNKELTLDAKYKFTVLNYTFGSEQNGSLSIENLSKHHLEDIQNNSNAWEQIYFDEYKTTLPKKYENKNIIIFTKEADNFNYILILNANNKIGDLYIKPKTLEKNK